MLAPPPMRAHSPGAFGSATPADASVSPACRSAKARSMCHPTFLRRDTARMLVFHLRRQRAGEPHSELPLNLRMRLQMRPAAPIALKPTAARPRRNQLSHQIIPHPRLPIRPHPPALLPACRTRRPLPHRRNRNLRHTRLLEWMIYRPDSAEVSPKRAGRHAPVAFAKNPFRGRRLRRRSPGGGGSVPGGLFQQRFQGF